MRPISKIASSNTFFLVLAAVLLQACGGSSEKALDPSATYEVYGASFEPSAAIPAQALLAEAGPFDGRMVLLEGVLSDGCASDSCWMTLGAGAEKRIRIFLPAEESFPVPSSVAGRRAVLQGTLNNAVEGMPSALDLHATGVMVEKVRS